ncbi:hypothetical protein [Streptomyces sp. NPDC014006]|uniref:hypothetical protein n=1 Tax=Streptomyces sp. NPDC014006 TaxID=3364870 RepID=UPI0036FE3FEC
MTQSLPLPPADRPGRLLRAVTIAACVPYLALKTVWISGSRVGIPDGSPLLEHPATMAVANGVTVLMDGAVIVLALLLTRPWGRRVPAWLLALPAWVATGLLAPIMAGYPLQLLVTALGGRAHAAGGGEPFLDAWVFAVVYTGFIVQGLCLGALFVRYARDRWGGLWRGRVGQLPSGAPGSARRMSAGAAAVLAPPVMAPHLVWLSGGTAGLSAGRVAGRDSGFYVMEVLYVVFLASAVVGGLLLAFRRGRKLPVAVPLTAAWLGSGATACWGGWLAVASLTGVEKDADRPTSLMNLTYAGHMIVGLLVAAVGVSFLVERSVRLGGRPAPGAARAAALAGRAAEAAGPTAAGTARVASGAGRPAAGPCASDTKPAATGKPTT